MLVIPNYQKLSLGTRSINLRFLLLLFYLVDSVLAVLAELELRSNDSREILVELDDPLIASDYLF